MVIRDHHRLRIVRLLMPGCFVLIGLTVALAGLSGKGIAGSVELVVESAFVAMILASLLFTSFVLFSSRSHPQAKSILTGAMSIGLFPAIAVFVLGNRTSEGRIEIIGHVMVILIASTVAAALIFSLLVAIVTDRRSQARDHLSDAFSMDNEE
ncbi:MAG: hypothetical protein CMB77_02685 [Euryarchaeota archaeon]|nr:hypothetical protein [Euryarchaeota archaeon]